MASSVKLYEHPEFQDTVIFAKEYFNQKGINLTEQFIEKDYYVTEALRIIATNHTNNQIIFKGGTSLSKGWQLIERFSEDIDLFLNKEAFSPPLSRSKVDKKLEKLEELVSEHSGLTLLKNEGKYTRGESRYSYFSYNQIFTGISTISNKIFLESGTRSGYFPVKSVELTSYIGLFLKETENSLDTEDESSFEMKLLDFRRTFVEKLFTIHSKILKYEKDQTPIGTYARHYYDLYCLVLNSEVKELLENTEEYDIIKKDCEKISRTYFDCQDEDFPKGMKFSNSKALFPNAALRKIISQEYQKQCQSLCYGTYPTWNEVEGCFENIKDFL